VKIVRVCLFLFPAQEGRKLVASAAEELAMKWRRFIGKEV
jgi:hypothetical protein